MKNLSVLLFILLLICGSVWGQSVTPLSPLLAGENIATPIVLSGSLPITTGGNTTGYLDDYDEACPYTSTAPDVVYSYTPSSNVIVDIDLCGSSYDTKVFVYENAATPGNPFACNDDFYLNDTCGIYVSKIEGAALAGGNTYYIVIDGYSGADYGDYALVISELITPPVPCPPPAALSASNITQATADLGWTETGSATAWEYVYGISPLPAPSGSGTATSSNLLNPISGLNASTEYQYYVRANCGTGFSAWAGPGSFTTSCNAIASLPYNQGFETAWPPGCWTDPKTADYGWNQSIFGAAHSGLEWAYCNLANSQLMTPVFNLSSDSRLIFWYRVEDAGYPQDISVKIGADVIYQITGATNETYQQVQVSLAGYTGLTVSISFIGETGTGGVDYGICLDDVSVRPDNNYWTGNISTSWNNNGNWSGGIIPDLSEVVFIPSSPPGGIFPIIESGITAQCYKITISTGASLKVKSGGTLIVLNP